MVKGQNLVYVSARIAEAWYLMLSAQFAFIFQPVIEYSFPGRNDFQGLQSDVFVSFGFIVGIDFLKFSVQNPGKITQ